LPLQFAVGILGVIDDYELDGDLTRLELKAELLLKCFGQVWAFRLHFGAWILQPVERNVVESLETSGVLDLLAEVVDQIIGKLRCGDAVPQRADAALDDPSAGDARG
jgi:hypothetical protein